MSRMKTERNDEIYRLAIHEGQSRSKLASRYKISSARISHIVSQVGKERHGRHLTLAELRKIENSSDTQENPDQHNAEQGSTEQHHEEPENESISN